MGTSPEAIELVVSFNILAYMLSGAVALAISRLSIMTFSSGKVPLLFLRWTAINFDTCLILIE